jgi:tetratricopeptide (TPR) repeat protein
MERPIGLMPALISTPSQNTLPVWDSFEAIFFVLAGIIVGFVLGYLFPSIWRTLRRRFRSHRRYILTDIPWHRTLEIDLDILPLEKKLSAMQDEKDVRTNFSLVQSFVIARDFVQRGEHRHAVKIYGEILTSDQASTSYIHRALFELAQVYFSLSLYARAFDTALELFKRRRRDALILQFLLLVLSKYPDEEKLLKIFRIFKGIPNEKLVKQMAQVACLYAEKRLVSGHDHKKLVELTRLALRIDGTWAHALFLLWQSTSQTMRYKRPLDVKAKWIAFAADLDSWIHLCEDTNLSPHAGAHHISSLLVDMLTQDPNFESFQMIQPEFKEIIDFEKFSASQQKILLESIFSAILLIREVQTLITEQNCLTLFNKICHKQQILQQDFFVNGVINPNVLKLGILAHSCPHCQSLFARFNWSCSVCHSPEPLMACLPSFTECAFHVNKNWNPHKGNIH